VGHVVDDAVEAPIQDPVTVGASRRIGIGDQPPDLVVDVGELVDLGAGAPPGSDAGDRAFHAAENGEEVNDIHAAVDRDAASDLPDDLDQALAGQPAERLHDRLFRHPEFGLERFDGQPLARLVLAFEQALLEQVVDDRGQAPT
jgi:hypothetical protein